MELFGETGKLRTWRMNLDVLLEFFLMILKNHIFRDTEVVALDRFDLSRPFRKGEIVSTENFTLGRRPGLAILVHQFIQRLFDLLWYLHRVLRILAPCRQVGIP